jgi:hypothetical protein
MKKAIVAMGLVVIATLNGFSQQVESLLTLVPDSKPKEPIEIMFLGSTHFSQDNYKNAPKSDLFNPQLQKEIVEINKMLQKFEPDMIMIERTPEDQTKVDSIYALFKSNQIQLIDIENGRGESYQFGFNLAKSLKHDRIFGVDYYESVSNRMLTEGHNIDLFQKDLSAFAAAGREADTRLKDGRLSLKNYLLFLNTPEMLEMSYRVMFVTPARVTHGKFLNPPSQYVDTSYVNQQYIGAEYISVFHERELKIYSNIVTTQLAQKGKRILVIMGQRHAAALPKLFENDPAYKVVKLSKYLK